MRRTLILIPIFMAGLVLAYATMLQTTPPSTGAILTPIIASYRQPGRTMCVAAQLDRPDGGIVGLPSVGEPGVEIVRGVPNWSSAGQPVERGLSLQLDYALQRAVKDFRTKQSGIRIRHVPAPFILFEPKPAQTDCNSENLALLKISEPLISGDFAFVRTDYDCGALCGEGFLRALKLIDGKWQIVGETETWIS